MIIKAFVFGSAHSYFKIVDEDAFDVRDIVPLMIKAIGVYNFHGFVLIADRDVPKNVTVQEWNPKKRKQHDKNN